MPLIKRKTEINIKSTKIKMINAVKSSLGNFLNARSKKANKNTTKKNQSISQKGIGKTEIDFNNFNANLGYQIATPKRNTLI